ncbi:c-type cytochrome [Sedimenticola thiotaurini]|nr:c-type cytochrome [Sedimenticola thiotaurini]
MTTILLLFSGILVADDNSGPLSQYQPQLSESFRQQLREADLAAGERTFMRKCSACHDHKKQGGHGKGPHLWNLFNRKAGSIDGFKFSAAMRDSGHTWTINTLNYYLTNTERAVPGRLMEFRGIRRDQERANLIAFLLQFNDNPPALSD